MPTSFRLCVLIAAAATFAPAQYINHPVPGTPRTRDGKPNLTAPAPRLANGKPDLSGIWQGEELTANDLKAFLPPGVPLPDQDHPFNGLGEDSPSKYFLDITADFPQAKSPLLPAALPAFIKNASAFGKDGPDTRCLPSAMPMMFSYPTPYKLVQSAGLLLALTESDGRFLQIYLDGRAHPKERTPTWAGYSVGKWEGDTLVVDTVGFNDKSWLDVMGHTHSEAMHLTTRLRRRDFGHMDVEVTVDDPKTFSRPFTVKIPQRLRPDTDLIEYVCNENEKDVVHLDAANR